MVFNKKIAILLRWTQMDATGRKLGGPVFDTRSGCVAKSWPLIWVVCGHKRDR